MTRRIVVALIAAICVAIFFALYRQQPSPATTASAGPKTALLPPFADPLPHPISPLARDRRPSLLPPSGVVELCGYGPIEVRESGEPYPPAVIAAAESTLARVADAMSSAADPAERAAGLFLLSIQLGSAASKAYRTRHPGCENDTGCLERESAAARQAMRVPVGQLAAHAAAARNAPAYALAYDACRKFLRDDPADGPCGLVSAAQWAQLEPDNLIPWMEEARQAIERKDVAAHDAALQRAAQASTSRLHWATIFKAAEHPIVQGSEPATRLVLLGNLGGIHAAFPLPAYRALGQQCGPGKDDARRRLCSDLATNMTQANTLMEISMGIRLGERVGWSRKRVDELQEKLDALQQLQIEDIDLDEYWSCRSLQKVESHVQSQLHFGEVGDAERALRKSDRSVGELAARFRSRFK